MDVSPGLSPRESSSTSSTSTESAGEPLLYPERCNNITSYKRIVADTRPLSARLAQTISWRFLVPHVTEGPPVQTPGIQVDDERRRPGRSDAVHPQLLPLLRDHPGDQKIPKHDAVAADCPPADALDIRAASPTSPRDIVFGLLLAVPLWAILAIIGWWLSRR
jgi:hypothetical protein